MSSEVDAGDAGERALEALAHPGRPRGDVDAVGLAVAVLEPVVADDPRELRAGGARRGVGPRAARDDDARRELGGLLHERERPGTHARGVAVFDDGRQGAVEVEPDEEPRRRELGDHRGVLRGEHVLHGVALPAGELSARPSSSGSGRRAHALGLELATPTWDPTLTGPAPLGTLAGTETVVSRPASCSCRRRSAASASMRASPSVDVELGHEPAHRRHALALLGGLHAEPGDERGARLPHVVGVHDERLGELARGAGELAEHEHALFVVAGGDELLGDEVHAVVEAAHVADVRRPEVRVDGGGLVVRPAQHDGLVPGRPTSLMARAVA